MEVTASAASASDSHDKARVSFTFPTPEIGLTETARLLETFSEIPPTTTEPPMAQIATSAPGMPFNLSKAPGSVDDWPKDILRLACTHCGHYVETSVNEETEYMGYKTCCTGKPVFRRSFVHYCPNCGEGIGFHYTGEDCFCNHRRSTMTCDRVIAASCWWQGCCE